MTLEDFKGLQRPQTFLTTDEVLGYLKVTSRTIYRLIRDRELPAVRVGRHWRFSRADVDAWVDAQRVGQGLADGASAQVSGVKG